mgnify:CR=1 FL=1
MKPANKAKIEEILTDELKEYVNPYEITNTILKMDNGFDSTSTIDKTKLNEACEEAIKYLNSITLPMFVLTMQAVYKNKVFIALGLVNKVLA